jgi:hypothetical protein
MQLGTRRAYPGDGLRDHFEQYGAVVAMALALGSNQGTGLRTHPVAPTARDGVIHAKQDAAAKWLLERRDLAERRRCLAKLWEDACEGMEVFSRSALLAHSPLLGPASTPCHQGDRFGGAARPGRPALSRRVWQARNQTGERISYVLQQISHLNCPASAGLFLPRPESPILTKVSCVPGACGSDISPLSGAVSLAFTICRSLKGI